MEPQIQIQSDKLFVLCQASDRVRGGTQCKSKYSSYCVADLDKDKAGPHPGWVDTSAPGGNKADPGECGAGQGHDQEVVIISQHEVSTQHSAHRTGCWTVCCVRWHTTATATPTPTPTRRRAPSRAWPGWWCWGTGSTTSRTGWPSAPPSPRASGAGSPPAWPCSATSSRMRLVSRCSGVLNHVTNDCKRLDWQLVMYCQS